MSEPNQNINLDMHPPARKCKCSLYFLYVVLYIILFSLFRESWWYACQTGQSQPFAYCRVSHFDHGTMYTVYLLHLVEIVMSILMKI